MATKRTFPRPLFVLGAALLGALALGACDGDSAGQGDGGLSGACSTSDLIAQCPAGSSPLLGARAESSCAASATGLIENAQGEIEGSCVGFSQCRALCLFADPCPCGITQLSREGVVCADCSAQASCGNGVCEGGENPLNCAIDCGPSCVPDTQRCNGELLEGCTQQGRYEPIACAPDEHCSEAQGPAQCVRRVQVIVDDTGVREDSGLLEEGRVRFGDTPLPALADLSTPHAPTGSWRTETIAPCQTSSPPPPGGGECLDAPPFDQLFNLLHKGYRPTNQPEIYPATAFWRPENEPGSFTGFSSGGRVQMQLSGGTRTFQLQFSNALLEAYTTEREQAICDACDRAGSIYDAQVHADWRCEGQRARLTARAAALGDQRPPFDPAQLPAYLDWFWQCTVAQSYPTRAGQRDPCDPEDSMYQSAPQSCCHSELFGGAFAQMLPPTTMCGPHWMQPFPEALNTQLLTTDRTGQSLVSTLKSRADQPVHIDLESQEITYAQALTPYNVAFVQYSTDGQTAAFSVCAQESDCAIALWHLPTQTQRMILPSMQRYERFALSPDGQALAILLPRERRVALYHTETAGLIWSIAPPENGGFGGVYFSPNGRELLLPAWTHGEDRRDFTEVWRVEARPQLRIEIETGPALNTFVNPLLMTSDGHTFTYTNIDTDRRPFVTLWDTQSGQMINRSPNVEATFGNDILLSSLQLSPDGRRLLALFRVTSPRLKYHFQVLAP